jgi:hypothetical protein
VKVQEVPGRSRDDGVDVPQRVQECGRQLFPVEDLTAVIPVPIVLVLVQPELERLIVLLPDAEGLQVPREGLRPLGLR